MRDRSAIAAERLAAARSAMESAGLDAFFLTTGTNLLFFSGYPFVEITLARPFYLIVPCRGAPVLIVHMGREEEARRYSWVDDVRAYPRLSVAPLAEIERAFDELSIRGGRIGVELGYEQRLGMPVSEFERVREVLAPAEFVDAADSLWRLRMVKSASDIGSVREACRVTTAAYERTFATTRVGEIDRVVRDRMQSSMGDLGGRGPWVLVTSGAGNYELATGSPVDRRLEPGDMLWMDSGCSIDGFWSDFSRAAVVGGPSKEQREAQRMVIEATEVGTTLVRPGVPVADIAAAVNDRLHAVGVPVTAFTSDLAARVGHGIGYDPTEPPHVSEYDPTLLEVGMVISIEPGFATDFGLFHAEQNVVVTPEGCEVLSMASVDLQTVVA